MTSTQSSCGRKSLLASLLLFFALLFTLTAARPESSLSEEAANTTLDMSSLYLDAEADCVGYEGQWNCLSDKFQHCASGKWTAALSCGSESGTLDDAQGSSSSSSSSSLCSPLGRTDEVEFGGECSAAWSFGGGSGWGGGGGGGSGGRGTVCNGNGCYYGAGANLTVEKWVYVLVVGVVALGFM